MSRKAKNKKRLTKTTMLHYTKLVYRSGIFVWALLTYIIETPIHRMTFSEMQPTYYALLGFLWVVFFIEMSLRFFPDNVESMGNQKQFGKNFKPQPEIEEGFKPFSDESIRICTRKICGVKHPVPLRLIYGRGVIITAALWILFNLAIFIIYKLKFIDDGILVLIALGYSVSDMVCILFFCPFQTFFLKNRCCVTCRIYNWDYLMMFTPLIFIKSAYTWSLAGLAFLLFLKWEIHALASPERFFEEYNANLSCINCREKLCFHKKQLRIIWKSFKDAGIRIRPERMKKSKMQLH